MARRSDSFLLVVCIFACFFLSGFSGLIYEVVWTRLLLTVFSASIYAVSTVLAAFMGLLGPGQPRGRTAGRPLVPTAAGLRVLGARNRRRRASGSRVASRL